ncbi:MAG: NAD(P)-binding domain-containing protein [Cyclobacteriaceae bacterium]|nr:NAD(P)-binding domain-containing protein [Cyclobacteriaceae bacterium]
MDHKYKCLIVDDMHPSIEKMLRDIGVVPHFHPNITRSGIIDIIAEFDILFIRSKTKVDSELLNHADNLKIIGRAGAGIDNLEIDWIESKGIRMINAPEGNMDALAEHTMGLLLALLNNISRADKEVSNKIWDREGNRGVELSDKTVGIIGYGNMGKSLVRRLKAFQCKVLIYDKYIKDYEYGHQQKASLSEIFEKCDIVSIHVSLTDETKGLINDNFLNSFTKNIYLVNTARGEVAENSAIVNQLKTGKLLGAALDVLENEKINTLKDKALQDFDYLISTDKVILTPHVGGWSVESYYKINKVLVDKLEEIIEKL